MKAVQQCQFAEDSESSPRCSQSATRKWGDCWFCDDHGQRKVFSSLKDAHKSGPGRTLPVLSAISEGEADFSALSDFPACNVIPEEERFYGYITSLGMEEYHGRDYSPLRLYATFEYNGQSSFWIVPSAELFKILTPFLIEMASERANGMPGHSKLWIGKKNGKWIANLP